MRPRPEEPEWTGEGSWDAYYEDLKAWSKEVQEEAGTLVSVYRRAHQGENWDNTTAIAIGVLAVRDEVLKNETSD